MKSRIVSNKGASYISMGLDAKIVDRIQLCPRCGAKAGHDPESYYDYDYCMKNCGWNSTYAN